MKKYTTIILIILITFSLVKGKNQPIEATSEPSNNIIKLVYQTPESTFDSSSIKNKPKFKNKAEKYKFYEKYFYDNTLNKDNTGFRYTVIRCKDNSDRFYRVLCTYLNNCGGEIVTGFTGQINSFDSDRSILIIKLPYNAPYIEDLQQMIETYLKS